VISGIIVWYVALNGLNSLGTQALSALEKAAYNKLTSVLKTKEKLVLDYFDSIRGELHMVKDNPWVIEASTKLNDAFIRGAKSESTSELLSIVEAFDPVFEDMCTDLHVDGISLLNTNGFILYTTGANTDTGRSILDKPFADTSLATAYSNLRNYSDREIVMGDFAKYAPDNNEPRAFFVARIRDPDGNEVAYVSFKLAPDKISEMMVAGANAQHSLEFYLVGSDGYMRSDSVLNPEEYSVKASYMKDNTINTEAFRSAMKCERDTRIIQDYNDRRVLSAWTHLNVFRTRWALICEVDEDAAMIARTQMAATRNSVSAAIQKWVVSGIFVVSIITSILAWRVAASISTPLQILQKEVTKISEGDLDIQIDLISDDEIGELSLAFNKMAGDLKESSKALRRSEEIFMQSAKQSRTYTWQVDTAGLFTYVHPLIADITGYSPVDIIHKKHFYDLHPDEDRDVMKKTAFWKINARENVRGFESRIETKDGRILWMVTSAVPLIDGNDKLIGYQGCNTDFTDRKIAEVKLQKHTDQLEMIVERRTGELAQSNTQLNRVNEELSQFNYITSHHLQEPLRIVASFIQLLENRYKNELNAEALEFINFANEGTMHMKQLINDLLKYSHLEAKHINSQQIKCSEVVSEAEDNLKDEIKESGAIVTYGQLPTISGDRTQIYQLFQLLIANAIKFKGDTPPRITIDSNESDDYWTFTVGDNGIGIKEEYSEKIFKIFNKLHNLKEYSGTGIGLAICNKIVKLHGGSIRAEHNSSEITAPDPRCSLSTTSEISPGTKFIFTIHKQQREANNKRSIQCIT